MKREIEMKKIWSVSLAVLAAALMMALPMQAFAAAGDPSSDPTASQYQDPGSTVIQDDSDDEEVALVSTPASNDSGGGGSDSSGSLPFTGFDVGILALVALLLGATGLGLRRLSAVN